ncbi:Outer envelope protein 64, mitochondrial [Turnera subulata]|uniref:Outer envelope protein 64, mitochondrial n=1 Tax=Turnera subulata TaxID=218843 RepID=A0A9Q0GB60_9ROSI|nr:Outer envelope protein 64, mitochondrial [Turnera subulata]
MTKAINLIKTHASNPKVWMVVIGVTVAGVVLVAEAKRRRRHREDFGAFVERFEILPFPQPPPPAAKQSLAGLTFAIKDIFDVKGYVTGFGNPQWKKTHEVAEKTAVVVTALLKNGATCVGKTVMDELAFGITGENVHYGTPINPQMPSHVPGGSSSGSAVAVAAELVDFALGTDTVGCIRISAAFCGIFGCRPSHGALSMLGVLPSSQSLDTVGWLARDASTLHRVGHALLQLNAVEPKRTRRLIFADDLFQLSRVPKQKTEYVISKAVEKLSGYQPPKHMNLGSYVAANVPSLKGFHGQAENMQNDKSFLKALSSVMIAFQRFEFKTNHERWVQSVKPKLGPDVSESVLAAINTPHDNIKTLYKVRTEMRAALQSLLKVAIPLGKHNGCPVSVSFLSFHGGDKFLLDTVLDMNSSLQEQVNLASNLTLLPDTNDDMDASELLKEKGNAAFKGKQWNKAVTYYTEAVKLNGKNATYYSNRAAAYLELGCFQQAEDDCSKAISLDKKNVKAYLRRGTARESLLRYKDAAQDFKHALVLEPRNKVASVAEKRLKKLMS